MRFISILLVLCSSTISFAQITSPTIYSPDSVWVVVNRNMITSVALGEFYCQQRKVPMDHILRLDLPDTEEMSRADYESRLLAPLKEKLKSFQQQDFILLTTYGVPIRVGNATPKPDEAARLELLKNELKRNYDKLSEANDQIRKLNEANEKAKAKLFEGDVTRLKESIMRLDQQAMMLDQRESNAAVDSELAMMWYPPYPLSRWQLNTRFFTITESARAKMPRLVMTCRIDGPTPAVAKRIIEDAIQAEEAGGPAGFAYVDARGINWQKEGDATAGTYGGYDESLRELSELFKKCHFRTTLNNTDDVFRVGSCPRTALYCGWYALQNYTPAFELMKGSIAYHIASFEAVSLREANNKRWVPNLLQDGACVSIGPVWEPYLIAFPKPATFFGFLLAGHTVVESYWLSNHFTSWQMMIIGDPLYRPYGKKPRLKTEEVKLSPIGSVFPPRAR